VCSPSLPCACLQALHPGVGTWNRGLAVEALLTVLGLVQTGKRSAASQGGARTKAPKLEIPETGLLNSGSLPTGSGPLSMSDGSPGSLVAAL
jgi:hypothetical protein